MVLYSNRMRPNRQCGLPGLAPSKPPRVAYRVSFSSPQTRSSSSSSFSPTWATFLYPLCLSRDDNLGRICAPLAGYTVSIPPVLCHSAVHSGQQGLLVPHPTATQGYDFFLDSWPSHLQCWSSTCAQWVHSVYNTNEWNAFSKWLGGQGRTTLMTK